MKKIVSLVALFFCVYIMCIPPGLPNFGNTCFINASLQALSAITPLANIVLIQDFDRKNPDEHLATGYKQLLENFMAHPKQFTNIYKKVPIKRGRRKKGRSRERFQTKTLPFKAWPFQAQLLYEYVANARNKVAEITGRIGCAQEDAEEFVRIVMQQLSSNWMIRTLIEAQIREVIYRTPIAEPSSRYMSSDTTKPQFIISLPITGVTARTPLEALLRTLFSPEQIESTPEERVTKLTTLTNYPLILAFSLKRFSFDPIKLEPTKIQTAITIPLELDMSPYYTGEEDPTRSGEYELKSAILHLGTDPSGGHYIAYIKKGGQWYKCNDAIITPVTPEKVGQEIRSGYIFFYQKKLYGEATETEEGEEGFEVIEDEPVKEIAKSTALIDNLLALRTNLEKLLTQLKKELVKEK